MIDHMNGPGSVLGLDDMELENLRLAAENRILRAMLIKVSQGRGWQLASIRREFAAFVERSPGHSSLPPRKGKAHLKGAACLCPECRVRRAGGG